MTRPPSSKPTKLPKPKPARVVVVKSCPACGWVDLSGTRTKCRSCFGQLEAATEDTASTARDAKLAAARTRRTAPAPEHEPEDKPVAPLMRGFEWWRR